MLNERESLRHPLINEKNMCAPTVCPNDNRAALRHMGVGRGAFAQRQDCPPNIKGYYIIQEIHFPFVH